MRDLVDLAARLRAWLPEILPVDGVKALTTGFSNDTFLVLGADLILRLPPAAGAMVDGHDVTAQARIYAELAAIPGAPLVPGIAAICEDSAVLGDPFFLMQRVDGEAIDDIKLQPWFAESSDGFREAICRQWVSAFAANARLQPLAALGAAVSPEDDLRMWQAFAAKANCPILVDYCDRLLASPAPLSGPPAVVHGDTKLSNLMWKDGAVAAMLDWEMALNGEPLADLGYQLYAFASAYHGATRAQKLAGMLTRDQVIALWQEVSGRSAAGVEWHEIAQLCKVGAIIAEGSNMWDTGRSTDPKLALFKQNMDYYLSVIAAMLDGSGL